MKNKTWYDSTKIVTYENLVKYFKQCEKGTIWKDSVNVVRQYKSFIFPELIERYFDENGYKHPPLHHTYINERGKVRLICSLLPESRLLQKVINNEYLLKEWFPRLITENCASLKGRGVDYALDLVDRNMVSCYNKFKQDFYYAKIDIHDYFDTIPHEYLLEKMEPNFKDIYLEKYFINLFKGYQFDDYIHNGDYEPYGIGLGGEIPQSFGILFLDEADHYMKEYFRFQYYVRYMDDIIIFSDSKNQLNESICYMKELLWKFHMTLNTDKTMVRHISNGFKFLKIGFHFTTSGTIIKEPNHKNFLRLTKRMKKYSNLIKRGKMTVESAYLAIQSSEGCLLRGDSYEITVYLENLLDSYILQNWLNDDTYEQYLEMKEMMTFKKKEKFRKKIIRKQKKYIRDEILIPDKFKSILLEEDY